MNSSLTSRTIIAHLQTSLIAEKGVNKGRNNDAAVDLKLTVPLYGRGGADYALTRRQAESAAAARYELEQARKNALENATKAWDTLKTARANVIGYKKQLDAAEKARKVPWSKLKLVHV